MMNIQTTGTEILNEHWILSSREAMRQPLHSQILLWESNGCLDLLVPIWSVMWVN